MIAPHVYVVQKEVLGSALTKSFLPIYPLLLPKLHCTTISQHKNNILPTQKQYSHNFFYPCPPTKYFVDLSTKGTLYFYNYLDTPLTSKDPYLDLKTFTQRVSLLLIHLQNHLQWYSKFKTHISNP